MKSVLLVPLIVVPLAVLAQSQTVWRCAGNTYTNDAAVARANNCKVMEGGNVTIVEGTRVSGNTGAASAPAATRVATAPPSAPRVESNEQKARDADARAILESELKKAEARREALLKEWNNGEPEKLGPETRNHQKYLDRVAELKASIARTESDIVGIRRELARAGGTVPASR